jgi:CRISPR-associated protein Csh2
MSQSVKFTNRVFGCVIIKSINANYNADFTHQPRMLPDAIAYATDKALKYLVKNYLVKEREAKLLGFRNLNEADNLKPRTLDETYLKFFTNFPRRTQTTGDFLIFKKDEQGNVSGLISTPKKLNKKQVEAFFKEKVSDDKIELHELSSTFKSIADNKKVKTAKIEDAQKAILSAANLFAAQEEEEEVFFFIEEGIAKKIEGDSESIEIIANGIEEELTGGVDKIKTREDLLTFLDVRLFGVTYAGKTTNISIHGPVQINHGINRFPESVKFSEQIMSPFRNSNKESEEKDATTLGSQSKLREGHYVHHFSVNPKNLEAMVEKGGEKTQTLTDGDIKLLKEGLAKGATYYDSAAKSGCENEFLLWVQLIDGESSKLVLPNFTPLVNVPKERTTEGKTIINVEKIAELLNLPCFRSGIEKVEYSFIPTLTEVKGASNWWTKIECL